MESQNSPEEPSSSRSQKPLDGSILQPGKDFDAAKILNLMTEKEFNKSGELFVVMDKHRTTVLQQPGLTKPFSTKRKKYAELVAKQAKGVVETYRHALKLVASSPCNMPPDSKLYNPDPAAPKIKVANMRPS